MRQTLGVLVGILAVAACDVSSSTKDNATSGAVPSAPRIAEATRPLVLEMLGTATAPETALDYVTRFESVSEARAHADAVRAHGGKVVQLDREGRLFHIVAQARALEGLSAPRGSVAPNTKLRFGTRQAHATAGATTQAATVDPLDGLVTARAITGVDALTARVPAADGRNAKVAVFDTGIDFDIEGVSTGGKLVGFYDLTGFGKVAVKPIVHTAVPESLLVSGVSLRVPTALGARTIEGGGVLDEVALARLSLLPAYDFDKNGSSKDAFPFVTGTNAEGKPAVWIDLDRNGSIDTRALEELTDYNTTQRTLDTRRGIAGTTHLPIAVTLSELASTSEVQFHSLASSSSHGTSCGSIIAGNGLAGGRLNGLANEAHLVSYLLDPFGQDLYTMDQLMAMFLHAKDQKVDAISISYGFARADLASARFLADFLDNEIASAGIVIGIAAGNEGPGIFSGAPDDYIPHHGFGVGAYISPLLARNVYGWTGATDEGMIHYSTVGPTAGGRLVPDIVSPFMNFARGRSGRGVSAFGGTSSATPALIGSVAALMSALKESEPAPISARLLKLAVQSSGHRIPEMGSFYQGGGLVDVASAYDVYIRLAAEERAARADTSKHTSFAYDLRAETAIDGLTLPGEGIVAWGAPATASVTIRATKASAALVDLANAPEPLTFTHEQDFFSTPDVLLLNARSIGLAVTFDATKLTAPGMYTDVITVRRQADGLALLRVPVLVVVGSVASTSNTFASVDALLKPQETWRMPVTLAEPSSIRFQGFAQAMGGAGASFSLSGAILSPDGTNVSLFDAGGSSPFVAIDAESDVLPAGTYEVAIVRLAGSQSTFGRDLKLAGALRLPPAKLVATSITGTGATFALHAQDAFTFDSAVLTMKATRTEATLTRTTTEGRQAFAGDIDLARALTDDDSKRVAIVQNGVDRALERALAMEVTFIDPSADTVLDRVWIGVHGPSFRVSGGGASSFAFAQNAGATHVVAYPNVADWSALVSTSVQLVMGIPLATPIAWTAPAGEPTDVGAGDTFRVTIPAGTALPVAGYGTLELRSGTTSVARLSVELP